MVQDVIEKENNHKDVKLVYGVNYEKDFMYDEHFSEMERLSENVDYVKVAAFDEKWEGEKGFVTDVFK
ncbi:MAG: hypothetical protein ACLFPF_09865 [Halanaerobiales bacterium]